MKKRKFRFAVVGLGKMGLLHASLLNVLPGVELAVLCDKSALMTRLFTRVFSSTGMKVVNDLGHLRKLDLDAAYVTTPISSHSSIVKYLYANNIVQNIFVEKTLALDSNQAKELCEISDKIDGVNMVGYMKRFSVVFRKAKDLLVYGNLGEPYSFKAYAYSSDFLGFTKDSKSSASRGGALADIGCHSIDLALWLLGDLEVIEVASVTKNDVGSETSISFTALSSSGLTGVFEVSQSMPNYRMPEFGLSIKCPNGTIDVNDDRIFLTSSSGAQQKWYKHDLNDTTYFSIGETEYFREDQQFVNSLMENRKCEPSFRTASKVEEIIDQARSKSELK